MLMDVLISNAVVATLLAAMVALATRVWRNPPLVHCLWLIVLLKLVTPGLLAIPLPATIARNLTDLAAAITSSEATQTESGGRVADLAGPPAQAMSAQDVLPRNVDQVLVEPLLEKDSAIATLATQSSDEQVSRADATTPAGFSWRTFVGIVWLAGSAVWILFALVRIRRFNRIAALARPAAGWLQMEAEQIAARYGIRRCPTVQCVRAKVPPLVWALQARPVVMLPSQLVAALTQEQLVALLAHELAHVRRGDHWIRRLEILVLAVYWWHPVAWLTRRQLQEAEELCCDAWVTWNVPAASRSYADAILQTVDFLSATPHVAPIAASRVAPVRLLERRIQMILSGNSPRRLSWISGPIVLAAGLLALPWSTHVQAQLPVSPQEKVTPAANDQSAKTNVDPLEELLTPTAEPRERAKFGAPIADDLDAPAQGGGGRRTNAERPPVAAGAGVQSAPPRNGATAVAQRPVSTPGSSSNTKVFNLTNSDAASMAEMMRVLFAGSQMRIAADARTNSVIAIGSPEDLMTTEAIMVQLDSTGTRKSPKAVEIQSLPDSNLMIVKGREENVKEAVKAIGASAEGDAKGRGRLQIQKVQDQGQDVLIIRGTEGELNLDDVAKFLKEAPQESKAGAVDSVKLQIDKLQEVIRTQQDEIKKLKTSIEKGRENALQKDIELEKKAVLRKQAEEAAIK